ncbi:MAG TPA: GMC family oxidoreductase N-terminal domain-containing protein [Candidatus Sulfotelmatobacter sp.]|nr:GMC family oxidoreductase N-terminal domain-containing protein [Candidatus Sulfotelmatobacter sp.]
MSSPITHPSTDVVVLGLGHTGGPIAAELTAAGYSVVGLEKGPFWNYNVDWVPTNIHDEWAIAVERKFDHPLYVSTFTLRNNSNQFALPMRRYTKQVQYHALGHGVGGAGTHWGGGLGRQSPWSYKPVSMTIDKYGQDGYNAILSNVKGGTPDLEDWPVSYDDMVPYYEAWEKAIGVAGDNQDPFIPNSKFPMPPHPPTPYGNIFRDATASLGYHPNPTVSGLESGTYTNQYGIARNACIYCGWCGGLCNYVCEVGAKSSSHVTTIPAALKTNKFDMRLESYVFRIDTDNSGKATGVRYYDGSGNVHIQPAKVIANNIWGFNLVRLMLLSGVGVPYNPINHTGSLGRGLANGYYPTTSSATVDLNIGANTYSCGNAAGGGYAIMDLNEVNPNYKHPTTFLGGISLSYGGYQGAGPGTLTTHLPGRTSFGSAWKASLVDEKLPAKLTARLSGTGPTLPLLENYIDLDPHYYDIYGDPSARITWDWDANTYRVSNYLINDTTLITDILGKMGDPSTIKKNIVPELGQHIDWWGHHQRGGARTGLNSATSVFNKWMQCWTCENVFASGEICDTFGDNITAGTHVAGAMAYLQADGIKKYLANPGSLI